MRCEDIQKELEAFLSDDIDDPKRSEIQSHVDKCQNCSEVLRELKRLSEVLHTWEEIEPSPKMFENLKTRVKAAESPWRRIFTYSFARKAAFRFAEVAAIVFLTLVISHLVQKPAPKARDDLAAINFYLKEHQGAVTQTISVEQSMQPAAQMYADRDDILYYEFIDNFPKYTKPGIIIRGPLSYKGIRLQKTPAISKGRVLSPPQVQDVVDFVPVTPSQLPHGYILETVRKIDDYHSLHMVYSNGIDSISLFEQPSHGKGGLAAQDFREYAVYYSLESEVDPKGHGRMTILAWKNRTLSFVLIGKKDMSQLMDIVQSIKSIINIDKKKRE
ncbi:MAG: hypothetical protein JSV96_18080 [Candidatus Aminicenantes bacterium]|nr:MAG: hypothetical protein JSV96_18080 [Candidatus Aminicenantes bacterium]